MKTTIGLTMVALAGAVSLGACAAWPRNAPVEGVPSTSAQKVRAVILVQKAQPLRIALQTGQSMLAGEGLAAEAFTIVVCGEDVGVLRAGGDLDGTLAAARAAGVRIVACGISLSRGGIAPESLAPGVEVVDNGLVEVLRLQQQGFLSVEL